VQVQPEPEGWRRAWLRSRQGWDAHFRTVDFVLAAIVGLALDWLLLLLHPDWADALVLRRSTSIFAAGAAVTGVLLGLTLTSLAIIADHIAAAIQMPDAERGTQQSVHATESPPADADAVRLPGRRADQLVGAFMSATTFLGLATVLALAGLVPTGTVVLKAVMAGWVLATVIAVGSVARCTSLLGMTVRAIIRRAARAT
jgi:hypothetical protein